MKKEEFNEVIVDTMCNFEKELRENECYDSTSKTINIAGTEYTVTASQLYIIAEVIAGKYAKKYTSEELELAFTKPEANKKESKFDVEEAIQMALLMKLWSK